MSPRDQNIIETLNLLTLLSRTQKQTIPVLSDIEEHLLRINKEHLVNTRLSVPTFINTLETLTDKGYLLNVPILETKSHHAIREVFLPEKQKEISNSLDGDEVSLLDQQLKKGFSDLLKKILPTNYEFDEKEPLNNISTKNLFKETYDILANHSDDLVCIVVLMPFRSIDRLLKKMNNGISFNDIQDLEIWYDTIKYKLHFGRDIIKTTYRGTASKAHFVFNHLFNKSDDLMIEYSDILEFDESDKVKENKAYSDSVRNLVKKNPKFKKLFHIYSDRLEIRRKYKNDAH